MVSRNLLLALVCVFCAFCLESVAAVPLQWEKLATVNKPSTGLNGVAGYDWVRHRIVMFGGEEDSDRTWFLNLTSLEWTESTVSTLKPPGRFSMVSAVTTDGNRFIMSLGETDKTSTFYNDLWTLDLATEQWTKWANTGTVPDIRYGSAGGITTTDEFYVALGFSDVRYTDSYKVQVDNETASTADWELVSEGQAAGAPFARCLHSGNVELDDDLVIFGGCGSLGHGPCPSATTYRLDTTSKQWSELTACNGPRLYSSMAPFHATDGTSSDEYLAMVGGTGYIYGPGEDGEVGMLKKGSGSWERYIPTAVNNDAPSAGVEGMGFVYVPSSNAGIPGSSIPVGSAYTFTYSGDTGESYVLYGDPADTTAEDCVPVFSLHALHGTLMFISWGLFLPIGVLIRYYLKAAKNVISFKIHKYLQSIGVFLAFAGFIVGIIMVPVHPFSLPHHFVGLLVMLMGCAQPVHAYYRPHAEPRTKARVKWEFIHKCNGRAAVFLGMFNCVGGLMMTRASVGILIAMLVWFLVYVIAGLIVPFVSFYTDKAKWNADWTLLRSTVVSTDDAPERHQLDIVNNKEGSAEE